MKDFFFLFSKNVSRYVLETFSFVLVVTHIVCVIASYEVWLLYALKSDSFSPHCFNKKVDF